MYHPRANSRGTFVSLYLAGLVLTANIRGFQPCAQGSNPWSRTKALVSQSVEEPDSSPGQCGFDPHGAHAVRLGYRHWL